jgi:hypothetical protein
MRPIEVELAVPVARGLLGATAVGDGPTAEQLALIRSLLHGYFGVEVEPLDLEPLSPDEVRRALTDDASRHRFVRLAIVLEFCRHPSVEAQADLVERYATALGVDEQMQTVARDAARDDREHLAADWARFREATEVEVELVDAPVDEVALQAMLTSATDGEHHFTGFIAIRRGAACDGDFQAVDHLGRADEPLESVRADLGIPPRRRVT